MTLDELKRELVTTAPSSYPCPCAHCVPPPSYSAPDVPPYPRPSKARRRSSSRKRGAAQQKFLPELERIDENPPPEYSEAYWSPLATPTEHSYPHAYAQSYFPTSPCSTLPPWYSPTSPCSTLPPWYSPSSASSTPHSTAPSSPTISSYPSSPATSPSSTHLPWYPMPQAYTPLPRAEHRSVPSDAGAYELTPLANPEPSLIPDDPDFDPDFTGARFKRKSYDLASMDGSRRRRGSPAGSFLSDRTQSFRSTAASSRALLEPYRSPSPEVGRLAAWTTGGDWSAVFLAAAWTGVALGMGYLAASVYLLIRAPGTTAPHRVPYTAVFVIPTALVGASAFDNLEQCTVTIRGAGRLGSITLVLVSALALASGSLALAPKTGGRSQYVPVAMVFHAASLAGLSLCLALTTTARRKVSFTTLLDQVGTHDVYPVDDMARAPYFMYPIPAEDMWGIARANTALVVAATLLSLTSVGVFAAATAFGLCWLHGEFGHCAKLSWTTEPDDLALRLPLSPLAGTLAWLAALTAVFLLVENTQQTLEVLVMRSWWESLWARRFGGEVAGHTVVEGQGALATRHHLVYLPLIAAFEAWVIANAFVVLGPHLDLVPGFCAAAAVILIAHAAGTALALHALGSWSADGVRSFGDKRSWLMSGLGVAGPGDKWGSVVEPSRDAGRPGRLGFGFDVAPPVPGLYSYAYTGATLSRN
ncbi:uncharacterized protein LOC62_03G003966 [Vanrija pseudolonga]|uniref:Uncharacterized protein n=1 Tax=Vanrija pseudolonga TaxID=143232 RepID=A0AAF0Y6W1_9TREE|nr:hypothetical protein LOC62_03G003966 [Vanrija pseudolonga]